MIILIFKLLCLAEKNIALSYNFRAEKSTGASPCIKWVRICVTEVLVPWEKYLCTYYYDERAETASILPQSVNSVWWDQRRRNNIQVDRKTPKTKKSHYVIAVWLSVSLIVRLLCTIKSFSVSTLPTWPEPRSFSGHAMNKYTLNFALQEAVMRCPYI